MRALDALSRRSSHMLCSSLSKSRNNQQKVCAAYRIAGPTCGIAHDSRPSAVISAGGCAGSDESWTMSRSSLEPAGPQNNTNASAFPALSSVVRLQSVPAPCHPTTATTGARERRAVAGSQLRKTPLDCAAATANRDRDFETVSKGW